MKKKENETSMERICLHQGYFCNRSFKNISYWLLLKFCYSNLDRFFLDRYCIAYYSLFK